ncbi:hypothetical protein COOONC_24402 [Cooperia oncophora]
MFRPYEHGCKQYKPTLRVNFRDESISNCISACLLCIISYDLPMCVFHSLACINQFFCFISIGVLIKQNPCLLVPFLTLQLIFMTTLGLLVVVWWIATLLASFDLVHYRSPFEALTNCEFFVAAGIVLLLLFIVWSKISLILYHGYTRTEREARYRRQISSGYQMSRSNTFPPTLV